MAVEVLLPKLGLTMKEGTIEEWLVPAGQEVREGEAILRLATDKVDVEVEAETGGHLHPVVAAGTTVAPGVVIAWLLAAGEAPPDAAATPPDAAAAPGGRLLASPNARRVAREAGVDLSGVRGTGPGGRIVSEDVAAVLSANGTAADDVPAAPFSPPG